VEWAAGLPPSRAAQDLFKRYRRLKAKRAASEEAARRKQGEAAFLREERTFAEIADDEESLSALLREIRGEEPKKGKDPGPAHLRLETEGALFFLGTSSRSNRHVTFRLARPEDWWFHVQGVPGAHVILRLEGKPDEREEALLLLGASLAAWHSGLRGERSVRVDGTLRKQVRSIPGAGPADVTYRDFRSFFVDPNLWRESLQGPA
jgi:predicted ribosome quality control (RQC) complex YloA/Tae2 family protein